MAEYFGEATRKIWSFAFEKAAFFLKDSDPYNAQVSWDLSCAFADFSISSDSIPAAALLFDRTVEFMERQKKARQEEEKRGSLIISPQEFERQFKRK